MDAADIVMLIVCVPLLIMVGILTYIVIALVLKEEFDRNVWPFNKEDKEDKDDT